MSPAVAEMAAQCCTTGIVQGLGCIIFTKKLGEKHMSAVTNHTVPKLESFGYIFVADILGVASVCLLYLAPKATALGKMMPNNVHSYVANS